MNRLFRQVLHSLDCRFPGPRPGTVFHEASSIGWTQPQIIEPLVVPVVTEVTLPIQDDWLTFSQCRRRQHVSDQRRVLILVVERDPYIKALEARLLESWGYQPAFAPDGQTALEMARQLLPKLLIAEILVPRLDGLRVCRELKKDRETSHIKVLIFSELLAERRAYDAGADAFLRKPLDKRAFLKTVETLLGILEPADVEGSDG